MARRAHRIQAVDGACASCQRPVYPYRGAWRHNYTRPTVADRFWANVDKSGDCWTWTAGRYPTGYGMFGVNRVPRGAHRVSWELTHGPIPAGLEVCHSCDNPPCVRPSHLWLGTHRQNIEDAGRKGRMGTVNRAKVTCKRGHPLAGDNLYQRNGRRHCRTCRQINAGRSHLTGKDTADAADVMEKLYGVR